MLNPQGGDGITKQTLYTTIQKFNGSADDIVVAILQTMYVTVPVQSNPGMIKTNSYSSLPSIQGANKVNQVPSVNNVTAHYPPAQVSQQQGQLYNTPQPYVGQAMQPVRQQPTPRPYVNQHYYNPQNNHNLQYNYPQNNYHSQNNLVRTAPTYAAPNQQSMYAPQQASYGQYQNGYGHQTSYNVSAQQGIQQAYGINYGTNIGMNGYGAMGMNTYGMGMDVGLGMGGAPVPPFNPLAALSFF